MRLTICFMTTTRLLSRLIRWVTGAPASHVAIGCELDGLPVVLQADVGGVAFVPRASLPARRQLVVAEYEIAAPVRLADVERHLGTGYDYAGLLGFAPVVAARWLRRKLRNPLASPRRMVCTELVLALSPRGEVLAWDGLDPEATTPADLLAICEATPGVFRKLTA